MLLRCFSSAGKLVTFEAEIGGDEYRTSCQRLETEGWSFTFQQDSVPEHPAEAPLERFNTKNLNMLNLRPQFH